MYDKINILSDSVSRLFSNRLAIVLLLLILFLCHWFFFRDRLPSFTIIMYPFLYLFILIVRVMRNSVVFPLEMWIVTNATWFITVMSRRMMPFAVLLFAILVWYKRKTIWGWWSAILLVLMWIATALYQTS